METLESGCVLLKQKEYDNLLAQIRDNKSKEIMVHYRYRADYYGNNFEVMGDLRLGDDLFRQIKRILINIDTKVKSELNNSNKIGENTGKFNAMYLFEKLPWYKRLFFKRNMVNK